MIIVILIQLRYDDADLIQNRTSVLVGTDLIKPYEGLFTYY